MTYSRTPIHKVVLVVLGILVAALPLTTAFSFPLPIVLAFIIPPALVSILLAALLCYKKNISAKDVPYSVENTYKLLKEYTVESWEPKYSSLGGLIKFLFPIKQQIFDCAYTKDILLIVSKHNPYQLSYFL